MSLNQQILAYVNNLKKSGVAQAAGIAAVMAQYSLSLEIATALWTRTEPSTPVNQWAGIGFPWGPSPSTLVTPKSDKQMLETSIEMILFTSRGERCMLPEFGTKIPDMPFEPNDDSSVRQINDEVSGGIRAWDDRINFLNMDAEISENQMDLKIAIQEAKSPQKEATQTVFLQVTPSMFGG